MHKPRKERNYENGDIPSELVRKFLKEYDLKDGKSISDFLKKSFGTFIQEALENELDQELGYSRYNYQTIKIIKKKSLSGLLELRIAGSMKKI